MFVAIHLPNSIQYVVSYYAIASIGGIITGINPTYKSQEILYQLKITNAHYLIVLDALYTHLIQPIIDKWEFKKVIWTNLVDLASGFSALKKFIGKKIQKIPNSIVVHPNAVNFMDMLKTPLNVPHVKSMQRTIQLPY